MTASIGTTTGSGGAGRLDTSGCTSIGTRRGEASAGEAIARAIGALERAFAAKALWLPLVNVDPSFDELRDDPRFQGWRMEDWD